MIFFSPFRFGGKNRQECVWIRKGIGNWEDELGSRESISERGKGGGVYWRLILSFSGCDFLCLYISDKFTIETMTTVSGKTRKKLIHVCTFIPFLALSIETNHA